MRDMTVEWVAAVAERRNVDLAVLASSGARSPTVTAVVLPDGLTSSEVRAAIAARGFTVGGGYGAVKDTTFRIGHMGDHTLEGVERCLQACEGAIVELAERKNLVGVRRS
jgi:aspartate aminotransferase-like enzyme